MNKDKEPFMLDFSGKSSRYELVGFKDQKNGITCPVCTRKHRWFCSVTIDDGLCLCYKVPSDKVAKDGRYIHIVKEISVNRNRQFVEQIQESKQEKPIAEIERIDAVYRTLLQSLNLKDKHFDDLSQIRGLSDKGIAENLYASVPAFARRYEIAQKLAESFDLEGVPGFYFDESANKWCLTLAYDGFFIPLKNEQGKFTALKIRRDDTRRGKFMLFSSKNKGGTMPESQLHFANPDVVRETKVIFITEGELKADIAADLEG